jgi:hypothetical protein
MLNRRDFLKYSTGALASASLLSAVSAYAFPKDTKGIVVNDVHSQLNKTTVYDIATPKTSLDLQALIKASQSTGNKISIAGARHAMGAQQFGTSEQCGKP